MTETIHDVYGSHCEQTGKQKEFLDKIKYGHDNGYQVFV